MHRLAAATLGTLLVLAGAALAQEPEASPTATLAPPTAVPATPTLGPPTATRTPSATATVTGTATPTLAPPSDPVGVVIYGVIVGGTHPWLRARAFPGYEAALRRLYEPGGLAPIWLRDGKPTAAALAMIAAFSGAAERGIPDDYGAPALADAAQRLSGGTAASAEEHGLFDTGLSIAALRYVSETYLGRVDPRSINYPYDAPRREFDAAPIVRELADGGDPVARLASLDPPLPQYAQLRAALAQYRALAARGDLAVVPAMPKLEPGDVHAGVPALRAHLATLGDLPADAPAPAPESVERYDEALAAAVKRYQARHGLAADGVIGPATLKSLQVPIADRVVQIELAMERMRWLPYDWPPRFLVVNLPEFRLRAYDTARGPLPALEMNVVVGEAAATRRHKTPVLMADMKYVVFRPYWMVPQSIIRKEIMPKLARDPDYLARNSMEMRGNRVRQRPGRGNSLGLVKFIFPNPHHVYLHDTPSKGLFSRARRDFSHGCIRVSDPPALAEFVLAENDGWDRARIERAMRNGPDDRHVHLTTPMPVYLLYATATPDDAGELHFFDDIYGHDASLRTQLAKGYPY